MPIPPKSPNITFQCLRNGHIPLVSSHLIYWFLEANSFLLPQNVKEAAYKGMVRPALEYGISVWDPNTDKLQEELEKVQNRIQRFVTRNYVYETGS